MFKIWNYFIFSAFSESAPHWGALRSSVGLRPPHWVCSQLYIILKIFESALRMVRCWLISFNIFRCRSVRTNLKMMYNMLAALALIMQRIIFILKYYPYHKRSLRSHWLCSGLYLYWNITLTINARCARAVWTKWALYQIIIQPFYFVLLFFCFILVILRGCFQMLVFSSLRSPL